MTRGSKTKDYPSLFNRSGVGSIFHRSIDWGHANLELQVISMQLLLASVYLSSSGERTAGVERENGEYTWRCVLRKWRKSMHNMLA
jgi:hypothetical protein